MTWGLKSNVDLKKAAFFKQTEEIMRDIEAVQSKGFVGSLNISSKANKHRKYCFKKIDTFFYIKSYN